VMFDPPASTFTNPCIEPTCVTPGGAVTGYFIVPGTGLVGFVFVPFPPPNGAITTIDLSPHHTVANSINTQGVITGAFGQNGIYHGFVCRKPCTENGNSFVRFDDPNATSDAFGTGTTPISINIAGAIAGIYSDANYVFHGFERDAAGHFSHFDAKDGGTGQFQGTYTQTINSSGEVTGWIIPDNNVARGFVWQP